MLSILHHVILDNTIQRYLIVTGILLLMFLLKKYMSRYLAGLLYRWVKRFSSGVDKSAFINLVAAPLQNFLLILITVLALLELKFPTTPIHLFGETMDPDFIVYKTSFHTILETIGILVLIISFISLLLRLIDFVALIMEQKANLTHDQSDNQLVVFFKDFFKVFLRIIGVLMILKFGFHYNIGSLLTGLSIAGAAIALATRESLENLIASFIIFFDKPFTVGDIVKVHQITGVVEKIGLRSTRIRTEQKSFVTVPNKQMVDSIMDNLSLRTQRRAYLQLEIRAQATHENMLAFIQDIENYLKQKGTLILSYQAFLADINQNALVVHVEFFTEAIPIQDFNLIKQQVNLEIIRLMQAKGLEFVNRTGSIPLEQIPV